MGEESSIKDELAANKATWGRSRCTSSGLLLWCATGAAGWAPALALALAICSPCAISVSHARRTLHHAIDQACFAARHWRSARLQKRALRLVSRQWLSRSPLWKLSVAPVLTSEALGLSIAHRCDTKGTPSGRCECGWYDVALLGNALALLRSALNHMYAFAVEWREE